jgi:hypothetical protein
MTRPRYPSQFQVDTRSRLDATTAAFDESLLACLRDAAFRDGDGRLFEPWPAWPANGSHDGFIALAWTGPGDRRRLVAVNFAGDPGRCFVGLPWDDLSGRSWRLSDLLGTAAYDHDGADLTARGLYLDLPTWGCHAFEVRPAAGEPSKGDRTVRSRPTSQAPMAPGGES